MASAAASDSYPSHMPLTPRDSDTEDPSQSSQMAGRKRSASEMEGDGAKTKHGKIDGSAAPETIEAEITPDFTIECPAQPQRAKAATDVYLERDYPSLAPSLNIEFAVRPGKKWSDLSRFKNAKFKDPFVVVYSAGQIVYVNRHTPIPPSPPADATEDERLQYDKENFWVGLISEFRAENQEKVYVRVFWLYWPDELPMGRQPYHGDNELVLSNHVDIIEAQTIACLAVISQWDENDDSNKTVLQERYWRQTFDLKKLEREPRNALSKLRKFCICGGYDNPGLDMYQCQRVGCGMWNHSACLVKDLEEKAWGRFQTGTLTHDKDEESKKEGKSFTQKMEEVFHQTGQLVKKGLTAIKDEAQSDAVPVARGSKKQKAATAGKKAWTGKLEAKIVKITGDGDDTHYATVTQLVPTYASKPGPRFEPKVWNMKMSCLKCGHTLN